MRFAVPALLISAVLLIAGCGGNVVGTIDSKPHPATGSVTVSWVSDGNDGSNGSQNVPPCGAVLTNCKYQIVVSDITTGEQHPLPITARSYKFTSVNTTDQFGAVVTGFNENGKVLASLTVTWTDQ